MSKVCIIGGFAGSLINFRGELIKATVLSGHEVVAMAAPADKEVVQKIEKLGATFKPFRVQRNGLNPLEDLLTWFSLRRAFKQMRPDVVLSYTIKPTIWSGLALRSFKDVRFYALITGLGYAFNGKGIRRRMLTEIATFLYRSSLKNSSKIIFQNPDDKTAFIKKKITNPSKCHQVNGSGVALQWFSEAKPPDGGITFLTISRLLVGKGLREYAKAAGIVKKRCPEATFRLIGPNDPSKDSISVDEVADWIKAGLVTYQDAVADVRPALRDCHIYVLPSYHEGMPRTVLEAMSVGRPILTTDVPGCRETVEPGGNGYLVPKGDANALAERMIWFIENRDQWRRMGRRSRELAEERFDVHTINKKMMTIMGLI